MYHPKFTSRGEHAKALMGRCGYATGGKVPYKNDEDARTQFQSRDVTGGQDMWQPDPDSPDGMPAMHSYNAPDNSKSGARRHYNEASKGRKPDDWSQAGLRYARKKGGKSNAQAH